jgi:hypothetical protein
MDVAVLCSFSCTVLVLRRTSSPRAVPFTTPLLASHPPSRKPHTTSTAGHPLTSSLPRLQLLWPGLFTRYGAPMLVDFDLSTLAHITDQFSSGALDCVVRSMLTKRRLERLSYDKVEIPEILQWLCKVRALLCLSSCTCCVLSVFLLNTGK